MMLLASAQEIAHITQAQLHVNRDELISGDIVIDNRELKHGDVFCAFKGETVDANSFAVAAIKAGASLVVLSDSPTHEQIACAQAHNTALMTADKYDCEEFLLRLAQARIDEHPEWLIMAVTGSVGKTTTKDMLAQGMQTARKVHATRGNYNSLIGLPLTVLSAPNDTEVLVLEMGMNHAGEIQRMSNCVHPQIACITNIGTSHIGLLGSREAIARAKGEILDGMVAHSEIEPTLVLDASGDYSSYIADKLAKAQGINCIFAATGDKSELYPTSIVFNDEGYASFDLIAEGEEPIHLMLSVAGMAAVSDLCMAAAMIRAAKVPFEPAVRAMAALEPANMRMNIHTTSTGLTVIDDSYNAAPASMAAALDSLRSRACTGRHIAILGEMGEMGSSASHYHALTGAYLAASKPDMAIIVGKELGSDMAHAAIEMGYPKDKLIRFNTREELISALPELIGQDDCVLIKASRAVGLDLVVKEVLNS